MNLLKIFNLRITKITASFKDIGKEMDILDNHPKQGFAFIHPLTAYSYDLRRGRKVITDMGIGRIVLFERGSYNIDISLDRRGFLIHRNPNSVYIVVILGENKKFKPLSEHDWKYIIDKVKHSAISFPVEYRSTTHGNYALTDAFKAKCESELGNLDS
jgi:hypothetical protein